MTQRHGCKVASSTKDAPSTRFALICPYIAQRSLNDILGEIASKVGSSLYNGAMYVKVQMPSRREDWHVGYWI